MNLKYYLGLLFWIPVMVQSQNAPVTVSHERSAKGEVTFYADNTSYSPFTVALTFPLFRREKRISRQQNMVEHD